MTRTRALIVILSLLAIGQVVVLVARTSTATRTEPAGALFLHVGDSAQALRGIDSSGIHRTVTLRSADYVGTVVLAYDMNCPHTRRVTRRWADWLGERHPGLQIIGVTRNAPDSAAVHRDSSGWDLDVITMTDTANLAFETRMLRRTPWLFVFDSRGVLRYEGHGSSIAQIDSLGIAGEE